MKATITKNNKLFMEIEIHNNIQLFHNHLINNGFKLIETGYIKDDLEIIMS
jgi:hypothetical protein